MTERLSAGPFEGTISFKLRLAQIAAWRAFEARLSGYGSAPRHLGLLAIIAANPGQRQTRLAESVGLRRSSLVAILDQLASEGLLERHDAEDDRRAKTVTLTAKGHSILDTLAEMAIAQDAEITAGLDPVTRAALLSGLDHVIDRLFDLEPDRA